MTICAKHRSWQKYLESRENKVYHKHAYQNSENPLKKQYTQQFALKDHNHRDNTGVGQQLAIIVVNVKFPLQPHQKYGITQYEELGFS